MYIFQGSVNVNRLKHQQIIFRYIEPTHLNNKLYYIYVCNNDKWILLHSINGLIDMFGLKLYMNTCSPLSEAELLPKSWDYASLLWNLYSLGWRYRDAGPKHCDYSQTSRVSDLSILKPPLNYFAHGATYCWLWLHHPPVVNILLLLPPILPYGLLTSVYISTPRRNMAQM